MLYWGGLEDATFYVIDLIQLPDGSRGLRFRKPNEPVHENTVLQSKLYTGSRLKQFGSDRFLTDEIQTKDGRQFGLDPHDIWMTKEETEYWRANHSRAALENPDAPWVNHLPPRFAPE